MRPFSETSQPVVMGHRGAPTVAPENTPASFTAAAEAGASWVELDARRSADGQVVVHHDAFTEDGQPVVALTLAALRERGVWGLADVLDGLPRGLGVDVELKNLPGEPDYDEDDELAALVASHVGQAGRPTMVSSFNPLTLQSACARLPHVSGGQLTTSTLPVEAGIEAALEVGADVYCPHADTVGLEGAVPVAHDAGLAVLVWTVDDPERARALAGAGVDALCTNEPALLVAALRPAGG